MPTSVHSQPDIADVVVLARALERDEGRPPGELRARERRVAHSVPPDGAPESVALAWLEVVKDEDEAVRALHQRAETAVHLTGFFIVLAGMLLGWGATLAAFYFDGSGRVNAVSVLALLVVLPGLMILPFGLAALPPPVMRRIPGGGVLAGLARVFSPGRLAPLFWRIFPGDLRDALALLSGRLGKQRQLYAALQKWALLRWSQMFAVAFQITALVACVVLVVFTDLAFGWSTTLTTGDPAEDARRAHRITSAITAPWNWAVEDARPSLELIEESRYYRAASEPVSREQAARLGGWWRFIALTIAVYGVLPRVLLLAFARSRLRAAARAAVLDAPGVSALSRRIHRARIETHAVEAETGAERAPVAPDAAADAASPAIARDIRAVINWSGVPVGADVLTTAFRGAGVFAAGGAAAVHDDLALARQLGANVGGAGSETRGDVLIVVKGWEPPLLEFGDFLKTLRGAVGRGTMILVLPLGLDAGVALAPAAPAQFRLWRDKLAASGDPWLRVIASHAEVSA